jgi:glycosyltransferase involved in cell wall biosynthesis
MRVALVHDYLNQYGGAERVLESLIEIFSSAPIYTLVYNAEAMKGKFFDKEIRTSFLQKIPFARSHHRIFPILMPLAIEKFDLSGYDIVVSDSASFGKGVITKPETIHICYCHTPPRFAWDDSQKYIKEFSMPKLAKIFIPFFMNYIRVWDKEAASRVDKFICNSNFVAQRIKKYYRQDAEIIYPPVDANFFNVKSSENPPATNNKTSYFLIVGRLLAYKKFDIAIEAFNKLELSLKIVGDGPEKKKLKNIARKNIEFLGELREEDLRKYYQECQALVFPQEEDFGIVALEAMACGKPVIAYQGGGALESVKKGETGMFFNEQTPESLIKAVKEFRPEKFNSQIIRAHALKFDKEIFKKKIKEFIEKTYYEHRN